MRFSERAKRTETEANGRSAARVVSAHPQGLTPLFDHPQGYEVFGVSEASGDGSKRPERRAGRERSPAWGEYQCSITRWGPER